jgi:potassium efflux system protein
LSGIPLAAQVPERSAGDQPASASGDAIPGPTLAEVEAALAAIEADAGIEDAVKELLRPKYKQAIDALNESTDFSTRAADYREAIQTAPETRVEVRAKLQALPSADNAAKVTAPGSSEDLQKDIESRRAALSGLADDLSKATSELARAKGRPVEISTRLPEVQRELPEIRRQLAAPELAQDATSPGRVADRILLEAGQSRLLSELEMLKQEQLSQSVREDLLQAQHDLLTRQVENAAAVLNTLEALLHQRLTSEAKRVSSLVDALTRDLPEGDEAAQTLAATVQAFAKEFEVVVEDLNKVKAAQDDATSRLTDLTAEYEGIREQLELGGGGGAMAQVLFDLRSRMLDVRADVGSQEQPEIITPTAF